MGDVPDWPLRASSAAAVHARALEIWARLWRTPQAVAWERLGWLDVIARYAQLLAVSELGQVKPALLGEIRQLEDRIGLTPLAAARLGWTIEAEEPPAPPLSLVDVRSRMEELAD